MMKKLYIPILTLLLCASVFPQSDFQQMFDTEKDFEQAVANKGTRAAFLEYLADDSVIFHPNAVDGREFWKTRQDSSRDRLVRRMTYSDIAANGLLGYTTGSWRLYAAKSDSPAKFGQYVTVWEKKPDGKFRASVDIDTSHDEVSGADPKQILPTGIGKDMNERGWSPADASMNFLRMSMTNLALSGAYKQFAAEDVRLLRDREPPILGKKNVVSETKNYTSVAFPRKVALYQSADMAYTWNACKFNNSDEGIIEGNCLHIWKLRDKKWWIVLGVFAPAPNDAKPTLKVKSKGKNPK